jgi:hypothetical protein
MSSINNALHCGITTFDVIGFVPGKRVMLMVLRS